MTNQTKGASSELPVRPPAHVVMGAIADESDAQRAVTKLNEHGLSEDAVTVLHGKEGADALRNRGSDAGLVRSVLMRFAELASGVDDFVQRHIDAADRGEHIILVELPTGDSDAAEQIWRILATHNAHDGVSAGDGTSFALA